MDCPECGEEMDIINQTPRLQMNLCVNEECPRYDVPCLTESHEYLERIMPKKEVRIQ